jgi:hypothetical protein
VVGAEQQALDQAERPGRPGAEVERPVGVASGGEATTPRRAVSRDRCRLGHRSGKEALEGLGREVGHHQQREPPPGAARGLGRGRCGRTIALRILVQSSPGGLAAAEANLVFEFHRRPPLRSRSRRWAAKNHSGVACGSRTWKKLVGHRNSYDPYGQRWYSIE